MTMQKYQNLAVAVASGTALIGGSGNMVVITNPTITVKDAGTNNISTIFSDEGVTALANPFTGDSSGRFAFYASDGDYDVTVSKSGFNSYTLPDIQLAVTQTNNVKADGSVAFTAPQTGVSAVAGTDLTIKSDLIGAKNLIINALGTINQRGVTTPFTAGSANDYFLDRWRVVTNTEQVSFTTTANVVTMTAPAGGIEQIIEGLNIQSGTYVISWIGTATCQIDNGGGFATVANGGTFTLTGGTNATVKFSSGTVSKPQVEEGSVVTAFENRNYDAELVIAQKYFRRIAIISGTFFGTGQVDTTTSVQWAVIFDTMRIIPHTITVPTTLKPMISGGAVPSGTISQTVGNVGKNNFRVISTSTIAEYGVNNASTIFATTGLNINISAEI